MAKTADMREVAVSKLKPYERNAKIHGDYQLSKLKDSIREFGFLTPCLIDRDYNLIAGHGRVMAAQQLGIKTVPCVFVEGLTDAQRRAYILADNKLGELGEWNMEIVTDELTALADEDFDISLTGFDLDLDEPPVVSEDDYEPEPPKEPKAKRGDLYQLGRHRLMCGDSTDADDVLNLIGEEICDVTITSPPYGFSNSAKIREHYVPGADSLQSLYIEHDDDADSWLELMRSAWCSMQSASMAQFVNLQMLADNKRMVLEWWHENIGSFVDVIVWDKKKGPPQMQKNILTNRFEFVFVFSNESNTRVIPFADFHGTQTNVIELPTGNNEYSDIHRAVFPVAFPAALLNICKNAKTVFDPFGGTGTTMIACEELDRNCRMMEIDPHYVDVIIDRWEQLTGGRAVLLNG